MNALKELNSVLNIVRLGVVSSVDPEKYLARVTFTDKSSVVSASLKIIKCPEPWLPTVGKMVLCIFMPKGEGDGVIIGEV